MLFRYKITKSYSWIGDVCLVHYNIKIQEYHKNAIIFKWETCLESTLKSITEELNYNYCFNEFENALQEIFKTISKYGCIDKMIGECIRRFIIRKRQIQDEMTNIEQSLDNIVLTNGWNTIEIKENE